MVITYVAHLELLDTKQGTDSDDELYKIVRCGGRGIAIYLKIRTGGLIVTTAVLNLT